MWHHRCCAKIGDELTLSLAKNSHNWRLVYTSLPKNRTFRSPFTLPVSPFLNGHHGGAEICNEFTLSVAQKISPSLFRLSQMARAARRVIGNPRQMIKSCPVLYCSSHRKMNQINTKNYWKKKERLCVRWLRGDKFYLRKSTDHKAKISPLNWTNAFLICAMRSEDFLR